MSKNQEIKQLNVLNFKKLPSDIQQKILQMQKPESESYFFRKKIPVYFYLLPPIALLWLGYMFFNAVDFVWETWIFWIFCVGTMILVPFAVYALIKICQNLVSKLQNGFVFSKDEVFKVVGNRLEFWNLREIESLYYNADEEKVTFWIKDSNRSEQFKALNLAFARKLETEIFENKDSADAGLLENYRKPEFGYPSTPGLVSAFLIAASILLSAGIMYAANVTNRNFEDDQNWFFQTSGKSLNQYYLYKIKNPNGKYFAEAEQKYNEELQKLEKENSANPKSNPKATAIKSVQKLFETAMKTNEKKIYVKIKEWSKLNDEIIAEAKRKNNIQVKSFDYLIPTGEYAEKERKEKVFKDISDAFASLPEKTGVTLEMSEDFPADSPRIEIDYVFGSDGTVLEWWQYSPISGRQSSFLPNVNCEFNFSAKPEGNNSEYQINRNLTLRNFRITYDESNPIGMDKAFFHKLSADFANVLKEEIGSFK